jgi:hypothetical protein
MTPPKLKRNNSFTSQNFEWTDLLQTIVSKMTNHKSEEKTAVSSKDMLMNFYLKLIISIFKLFKKEASY